MKQITISIRFDEVVYRRLQMVADSEERPIAYIVRRFIQAGLNGQPAPERQEGSSAALLPPPEAGR